VEQARAGIGFIPLFGDLSPADHALPLLGTELHKCWSCLYSLAFSLRNKREQSRHRGDKVNGDKVNKDAAG
jgi:hypothetical protein